MRTLSQAEERQEWLIQYGVQLLKQFADMPIHPNIRTYNSLTKRIVRWRHNLADFERADRCWMCFNKNSDDLGQLLHWTLEPTICERCADKFYAAEHEREWKAAEHYREYGYF